MKAPCLLASVLIICGVAGQAAIAQPLPQVRAPAAAVNAGISTAADTASSRAEPAYTGRPAPEPSLAAVTRLDAVSDVQNRSDANKPKAGNTKGDSSAAPASRARKLSEQERAQLRDQVKQMRRKYSENSKPNSPAAATKQP